MKRILIVVASAAMFVMILVAGLMVFTDLGPVDTGEVSCPTYVPAPLNAALGPGYRADRWEVYVFEGQKGAPKVRVRSAAVGPDAQRARSCELKIRWAPTAPGAASDWRIGHIVQNPEALRGRTVMFNVAIKGSTEFRFDTARIYIHDGINVAETPFQRVTRDWQDLKVTAQVDPGAPVFEVWIRLLLDKGTIRPGSGSLYFVAAIEPQEN